MMKQYSTKKRRTPHLGMALSPGNSEGNGGQVESGTAGMDTWLTAMGLEGLRAEAPGPYAVVQRLSAG
jgi:hypothetical protein